MSNAQVVFGPSARSDDVDHFVGTIETIELPVRHQSFGCRFRWCNVQLLLIVQCNLFGAAGVVPHPEIMKGPFEGFIGIKGSGRIVHVLSENKRVTASTARLRCDRSGFDILSVNIERDMACRRIPGDR